MSDAVMRQTSHDIAYNRSHGGDIVALAEQIYNFMLQGESYYRAVISANNQVDGQADVSDLLAKATEIQAFVAPPTVTPYPDVPLPGEVLKGRDSS